MQAWDRLEECSRWVTFWVTTERSVSRARQQSHPAAGPAEVGLRAAAVELVDVVGASGVGDEVLDPLRHGVSGPAPGAAAGEDGADGLGSLGPRPCVALLHVQLTEPVQRLPDVEVSLGAGDTAGGTDLAQRGGARAEAIEAVGFQYLEQGFGLAAQDAEGGWSPFGRQIPGTPQTRGGPGVHAVAGACFELSSVDGGGHLDRRWLSSRVADREVVDTVPAAVVDLHDGHLEDGLEASAHGRLERAELVVAGYGRDARSVDAEREAFLGPLPPGGSRRGRDVARVRCRWCEVGRVLRRCSMRVATALDVIRFEPQECRALRWVLPHAGTNGFITSWGAVLAGVVPPR